MSDALVRFEHPRLLWALLVLVPALAAFLWWSWRRKRALLGAFVAARLLTQLTVGVSLSRQKARLVLTSVAAALLVVALARPQVGFSWEEARSRGLDVVVAIDTSRSMLATDVAPNRLRRAQLAALDLKRLARTDRLGLVAFAGSAFLQCPLTGDDEAFRQSVETLDVNIIPQGGTALAEAIAAAKSAFKEGDDNHKVIVLFTDGEDHDGTALEAAKQGAKDGLRIFTVGIGTPGGEMLRTTDVQGRTEFIKDADGNAVKSHLNEPLLRDMAQETGGFYLLLSGADTMNVLYDRGLAPLPKSDLASHRVQRHHERYQWVLALVVALLLIEWLLPERKPSPRAAAATAPVRLVAGLVVCLLLPALAGASTTEALNQYQRGHFDRAISEYERSLRKHPDDPRLQFNTGAAAFQNKDYEQALSHLNSALVSQDVPLQQRTYYNLGNTQFRLGEGEADPQKKSGLWEQSIRSYDSALRLEPKDTDADFNRQFVKKKLEELKQQQKQQQQQQPKQGQDDKDKQKDQDKQQQQQQEQQQQQSKDSSSKQDQAKDSQPKQDSQQQQQKPGQQDQAEQQEKKPGETKGKDQAQAGSEGKPDGKDGQEEGQAMPAGAKLVRMTPQQAMQLLEAVKGEEKVMLFRPVRTNRQDRVLKDW